MRQDWIKSEGNDRLLIFALGWASDPRMVLHIAPTSGGDLLFLYDYRAITPLEASSFARYKQVTLVAWSFGVWASEQILRNVPLSRAVALNGTPLPVDDRYGIPHKAFEVTLKGLARSGSTDLFQQRSLGLHYETFHERCGKHDFETLYTELNHLHQESTTPYTPSIPWSDAVVGSADLIFPPESVCRYWNEQSPSTRLLQAEKMPHFPFGDPEWIRPFLNTSTETPRHDGR